MDNLAIQNAQRMLRILLSKPGYGPWYKNCPGGKSNNIHYYYVRIPGSF